MDRRLPCRTWLSGCRAISSSRCPGASHQGDLGARGDQRGRGAQGTEVAACSPCSIVAESANAQLQE